MEIEIIQEDIDKAKRYWIETDMNFLRSYTCPIACALKRLHPDWHEINVCESTVSYQREDEPEEWHYLIPHDDARSFIALADMTKDERVEPKTLHFDVRD